MESQIPESGFPSGVAIPSLCLLILLLALAGLSKVLLDGRAVDEVPRAFVDSQERLAADTARSTGASATQSLSDLRLATSAQAEQPVEHLLDKLVQQSRWRGAAVLNRADRALVATRGEQVPIDAVATDPADALGTVVAGNGDLLLITSVSLPHDRVLVATSVLKLPKADPDPALRQSLHLTTFAGQAIGVSRAPLPPSDPALDGLVAQAGRDAAGESGRGSLLGPGGADTRATVAYAAVTASGGAHRLDLAVVTVGYVPVDGTAVGGSGTIPALLLAAVVIGGFLLVRLFVVRPVRRLRADALAVAGGDLDAPVRTSGTRETNRIAAAVETCRAELTDSEDPGTRPRGIPAMVVVSVAAVAVVSWSAGVVTLLNDHAAPVPDVLVTSLRAQTDRAGDALRRSVNDGLADLADVVALSGADGHDAVRASAERLAEGQSRYRSVYLVDKSGAALAHVGRTPLRATERSPIKQGIRQQNSSGRVPVIFAHVPLPDGKHTLVGEFDIDHIAAVLALAPGRARLVDAEFRTISATSGYVAFEQVTDLGLRDSVVRAQRGDVIAEVRMVGTREAIVASAALSGGDAGKLGWTVVAEAPVAELALSANNLRKQAELVALIGVLLAALMFGWHLFGLVNPLRRVAAAADRLAAGDADAVIYPQRHDEIGTIASCLEVCRQAVNDGHGRLGEVRRPHGSANEETTLMRPVEKPEPAKSANVPNVDLPRQLPARRPSARSGSGSR
ncbi:HAMP domain-containing protein [Actinokineospora xionganensis]|uniref:histidine kinase n=1 Tax=Actinokineospora xionganensis TaxID=2684470 RepID=A0ABR7L5C8_9PSEU|nr:HAMP domain-containing protein [Actinokineospora xionganensis]MBC6447875.1 HAMP domain-containing protein [Actinokineospora xionganensis]